MFEKSGFEKNGVIIHSDLLLKYHMENFPGLYLVSFTTKVLTDFIQLKAELDKDEFSYGCTGFSVE